MVPNANQRQDAGFEARKLPRPHPQRRTVASRTKVRILLDVEIEFANVLPGWGCAGQIAESRIPKFRPTEEQFNEHKISS